MSFVIPAANVTDRKRVTRPTGNIPQTAQTATFTVVGAVRLISIVGRVTTAIQAAAVNLTLTSNPTVGADSDICANADLNNQPAGTVLGITGTLATALQISATEGALPDQVTPVVLQPGTLDVVTDASRTGQVEWTATYEPITADGAMVAL